MCSHRFQISYILIKKQNRDKYIYTYTYPYAYPYAYTMIDINQIEKNGKYYIKLNIPYIDYGPQSNCGYHELRIKVLNIKHRKEPYAFDYVTIQVLESSKDTISECGRNSITIPMHWIKEIETLSQILQTKTIDDMVFLIEQYV